MRQSRPSKGPSATCRADWPRGDRAHPSGWRL